MSEHLTYLNFTETIFHYLSLSYFEIFFSVLAFDPILGYKLVTGGFNDGSMSVRRMTTGALNHFFRENSFRSGFGTTPHRGHFRRKDFSLYKNLNILLLVKIRKSARSTFGKSPEGISREVNRGPRNSGPESIPKSGSVRIFVCLTIQRRQHKIFHRPLRS